VRAGSIFNEYGDLCRHVGNFCNCTCRQFCGYSNGFMKIDVLNIHTSSRKASEKLGIIL
jgi:hypothetical protein